ncbi:PREDICTED: probable G-protein coupled receptor 19 [Lepidothrix coronata]|uniref:Probable G-protein coupled receptor 19 n=1 Tax=Lepidothrix coronata TaxID=321398 RepID=A0A6J0IQX1_9PASS|nr:PREDICTED: probable G-protein coupled receptor 19 [Lepidothrix coronata]
MAEFAQSMDNSSSPFLLPTLLLLLQNMSNLETSIPPAGYEMTESSPTRPGSSRNHTLLDYGLSPGEIAAASMAWGVLWLVSILGNSLLCLVMPRSRKTQSPNYFVVSMACADLLTSVVSAPFLLLQLTYGRWMLGNGMCKLVRYIQYLTPAVQIYVLFSIGVARCYTLIRPLNFKMSKEKAKKMILASWLCGALFASPAYFLYDSDSDHHCNFFLPDSRQGIDSSIVHLPVLLFLIPALFIILCYEKLFTYIWRKGTEDMAGWRTTNLISRRKVKNVKMFFIFNLVFLLSWLPFYMVQLWHPQEADYRKSSLVFLATTWISFSSSASKPILFYIYNANFRRGMKETCCMFARKYQRSNIFTITTSYGTIRKNHVWITDIPAPAQTVAKDFTSDAFNGEVKKDELLRPDESNPPDTFA